MRPDLSGGATRWSSRRSPMSLVLLVGAGVFLRSWQQMLAVDPGFGRAPTSVLSVMVPVARRLPTTPCSVRGVCSNAFGRCPASKPPASSGRCRSSSPPAPPTSRSTVVFHPLAGRPSAPTAREWTAGSSTRPAWRSWLAARSTMVTGATVGPWPSSVRRWPVATGRTATHWAASSAGRIRPRPTW